ncbi:hypothetical protein NVP1151O_33 [Vibrio phage 1.151.O._10N.222.46.B1]|nr:hypothetical protein NVP1151O_33 [Vibrio phage 1.151.O._10N.222.46.B1]
MIVYVVIYVSFDHYRFENFIGVYGCKDEAVQAAVDSDLTDNILILNDKEIKKQPGSESEAQYLGLSRGYFWLHPKEIDRNE